jgi:alkyldihydroxyacetonephosphate synthase
MDFKTLALSIQRRQQELTVISDYHLKAASLLLSLEPAAIQEALLVLGCRFWHELPLDIAHTIRIPKITPREAWSVTMQFGHVIAPYLKDSHKFWASWLFPCHVSNTAMVCDSDSVIKLIEAFETLFDAAKRAVDEAIERLSACPRISRGHVLEGVKQQMNDAIPEEILVAYCTHILDFVELPEEGVVETTTSDDVGNDYEALGMWGFRDSRFQIRPDVNGKPSVVLSGSRYRISGTPLKKLIPFIEKETNTVIDIFQNPRKVRGFQIKETELSEKEIEIMQSITSRISLEPNIRIRHGTGHSQEEIYFLRKGRCFRVPDIVLWPSSEMEIVELIQKALEHSWNVIPYGGGTNVSQAIKCPSKLADPRPIISVDMTGLNRILFINEEDGIAHVQAGITGQELITALEQRGYTMGHEPDSFEFSTLGGWIATKASGMKRAKYGNIEDIVVDICVAGSSGLLWQGKDEYQKMIYGRQSRGPNMMSIFFGSEGCLGIITSAFVRICPLPQHREYDSILLPDFSTGLRLVYDVSRLGSQVPASIRLLDNAHFRLGQALSGEPSISQAAAGFAMKLLSSRFQSMSVTSMVCATLLFEGSEYEVREQRKKIKDLANNHGGISLGPEIGRSGYELTFVIAYIRDFALSFNYLGDSFETFCPWSKIEQMISSTKDAIKREHKLRYLPGEIFVGCRVTQLYHEGACVYFYMCMHCGTVGDASLAFAEIENVARQEILRLGGSLSHHHGIGKLRSPFLREMGSNAYRDSLLALKKGLDPLNTFGAGNGVFGEKSSEIK